MELLAQDQTLLDSEVKILRNQDATAKLWGIAYTTLENGKFTPTKPDEFPEIDPNDYPYPGTLWHAIAGSNTGSDGVYTTWIYSHLLIIYNKFEVNGVPVVEVGYTLIGKWNDEFRIGIPSTEDNLQYFQQESEMLKERYSSKLNSFLIKSYEKEITNPNVKASTSWYSELYYTPGSKTVSTGTWNTVTLPDALYSIWLADQPQKYLDIKFVNTEIKNDIIYVILTYILNERYDLKTISPGEDND